jgi:hypothetical protein
LASTTTQAELRAAAANACISIGLVISLLSSFSFFEILLIDRDVFVKFAPIADHLPWRRQQTDQRVTLNKKRAFSHPDLEPTDGALYRLRPKQLDEPLSHAILRHSKGKEPQQRIDKASVPPIGSWDR